MSSEKKPTPRPPRQWKLKMDTPDDKIIQDITQHTKRALFPDGETKEKQDEEPQVSQSDVESKDGANAGTFKDWF